MCAQVLLDNGLTLCKLLTSEMRAIGLSGVQHSLLHGPSASPLLTLGIPPAVALCTKTLVRSLSISLGASNPAQLALPVPAPSPNFRKPSPLDSPSPFAAPRLARHAWWPDEGRAATRGRLEVARRSQLCRRCRRRCRRRQRRSRPGRRRGRSGAAPRGMEGSSHQRGQGNRPLAGLLLHQCRREAARADMQGARLGKPSWPRQHAAPRHACSSSAAATRCART